MLHRTPLLFVIVVFLVQLIGVHALCPKAVDNAAIRTTYSLHDQNTDLVSTTDINHGNGFFEFPDLILDITNLRTIAVTLNTSVGFRIQSRDYVSTEAEDSMNTVLSAALSQHQRASASSSDSWFNPALMQTLTSWNGLRNSGMFVRANPQGFAERYVNRINVMGRDNAYSRIRYLVEDSSSANGATRFLVVHIALSIDPLANYEIDKIEELDVYANPGFFGDQILTDCHEEVYLGRVLVVPTDSNYKAVTEDRVNPLSLAFSITTFCMMAFTSFGLRLSGKAADGVTLSTMAHMTCAGPREMRLVGTYRVMAPFALDETLGGMLGGNCIALAAVWVIFWLLAVVIGRMKQAKSMEEAGALVWFPRVPMMMSFSLYPSLTFLAFRLAVFGVSEEGSGGHVAGGIIALIVFLVVVPMLFWRYAIVGLTGEYVPYDVKNVNCVWKAVVPTGRWVPDSLASAAGAIFTEMHCQSKIVIFLPFLSPAIGGLISSISPTTLEGCKIQYILLTVFHMVLVVVYTWFQPFRSRLDSTYAVISHTLLSIVATIQGMSAGEEIIAESFFIPEILLIVLMWLRFANDIIVILMDRARIPLAPPASIKWHDGSRNMEDLFPSKDKMFNADEGNILAANADDNAILGFGSDAPVEDDPLRSPITNASIANPLPMLGNDMKNQKKKEEKKAAYQKSIEEDPFASDDDDKKSKSSKKTAKDEDPFASDDDPFADNPTKPPTPAAAPVAAAPVSKMKGIAKKLLLAAKFKSAAQDSAVQRKENEMFGDGPDGDMLRGPKGEKRNLNSEAEDKNTMDAILGTTSKVEVNPVMAHGAADGLAAGNQKQPKGGDVGRGAIAAPSLPNATKLDPWKATPKEPTVFVYRVEYSAKDKKMVLERQEEEQFGSFFDGDSYVVLSVVPPKKSGEQVKRELFLWIGLVSTPDEVSGAESEAIAHDNKVTSSFHSEVTTGGHKITRIMQNNETTSFSSLFPNETIKVIEGGVDAGGQLQPRLYHVHGEGARKFSLTVVPPVVASLDNDDVFILDCVKKVYVFQGDTSSPFEKDYARQYGEKLKQNRAICVTRTVTQEDAPEDFWTALGSTQREGRMMELKRTTNLHPSSVNRLWKATFPTSGKLTSKNVEFALEASGSDVGVLQLDTHSVMIVDFCSVIFVWVGTEVKPYKASRDMALTVGTMYQRKHSDEKVPLVRVLENFEGETFDDLML